MGVKKTSIFFKCLLLRLHKCFNYEMHPLSEIIASEKYCSFFYTLYKWNLIKINQILSENKIKCRITISFYTNKKFAFSLQHCLSNKVYAFRNNIKKWPHWKIWKSRVKGTVNEKIYLVFFDTLGQNIFFKLGQQPRKIMSCLKNLI